MSFDWKWSTFSIKSAQYYLNATTKCAQCNNSTQLLPKRKRTTKWTAHNYDCAQIEHSLGKRAHAHALKPITCACWHCMCVCVGVRTGSAPVGRLLSICSTLCSHEKTLARDRICAHLRMQTMCFFLVCSSSLQTSSEYYYIIGRILSTWYAQVSVYACECAAVRVCVCVSNMSAHDFAGVCIWHFTLHVCMNMCVHV